MTRIAVTGATGALGSRAARGVLARLDEQVAALDGAAATSHGAAAAILADPDPWAGEVLEMTGSEALTLDDVARRLSAATGTEFRYVDETMAEARAWRAGYGAPAWQVEAWISTYTAIASGALAAVSDDVRRVLGRAPRTLEDVVAGR